LYLLLRLLLLRLLHVLHVLHLLRWLWYVRVLLLLHQLRLRAGLCGRPRRGRTLQRPQRLRLRLWLQARWRHSSRH